MSAAPATGAGPADGGPIARSPKRILVADDSETYRAVALRVLGDAGYQVDGARDGQEALSRLDAGPPHDLLVLELNLPRVRGLDLLRRVRETPRLAALNVLVVSDALTEHLRRVLSDLGMGASLTKNHALRDLLYQADQLLFPLEADQREGRRKLMHLPVNFWVGNRLSLESCFDLSPVGMFIVVADEEPPAAGTPLLLRFWLPSEDRLIACEAEVVWRNTASGDLRITHPPGMGVRFTRLEAADRERIAAFLGEGT